MNHDTKDRLLVYLETLQRTNYDFVAGQRLDPNPYQGLKYFDEKSSVLLTTRGNTSQQIRARFTNEQCVFVIGGSGCGKSSLVRGKILDELRNFSQPIEGRDGDWQICSFRPETEPVQQFVEAFWDQVVAPSLEPIDETLFELDDPEDLAAMKRAQARRAKLVSEIGLRGNFQEAKKSIELDLTLSGTHDPNFHDGFSSAYRWADQINEIETAGARAASSNLMIIIDQFEELFRKQVDSEEAKAICAMIRHAHRRESRHTGVYVAVSMRSEDIHRCAEVDGLADIVNSSVVLVDWLNSNDLKKAIVDPARIVLENWGVPFEYGKTAPFHPTVVDEIVNEVSSLARNLKHKSDHLPLMQHGLRELWKVAAQRWQTCAEQGKLEEISVEPSDLEQLRRQCGVPPKGHWLKAQLKSSAKDCYKQARVAYNSAFEGEKAPPVEASVALRAVLCEMASRDENGKIHRDFAKIDHVVAERLLPIDDTKTTLKRKIVGEAVQKALKVFSKRQLLVELDSKTEPTFDVTHEALIRNWSRFRRWIDEDAELLDAYIYSVRDQDATQRGQKQKIEIDEKYVPVLGPTCDWGWSRRLFKSKHWAVLWSFFWPGERTRYGDSYSRKWLVRSISDRKEREENADHNQSNMIAAGIVLGVRQRWRKDWLVKVARNSGVAAIGLFVVVIGALLIAERQQSDALTAQRNSMVSLMAVSNPELERAPHFTSLSLTMIGLKPKLADLENDNASFTKRLAFVARVENDRIARDRLGRMTQATTLEMFSGDSDSEEIQKTFNSNKFRNKYCQKIDESAANSLIETDKFSVRINKDTNSGGAVKLQFIDDGNVLGPISPTLRDKINIDYFQIPFSSEELCFSRDGRVAALTLQGNPVPQLYVLDVVDKFYANEDANPKHPKSGIIMLQLKNSHSYPEVVNPTETRKKDYGTKVLGIGSSADDGGVRAVYYALNDNPEKTFVAFFQDGLAIPSPVTDIDGSLVALAEKETTNWNDTTDNTFSCKSDGVHEFPKVPAGHKSEFIAKTVNIDGIRDLQIVISSIYEAKSDLKSDVSGFGDLVVFNVDAHHGLWGCKPLLLSSFVSSPTSSVFLSEDSRKGSGVLSLYMRDANLATIRKITLLHDTHHLVKLIEDQISKYDRENYLGGSAFARLSDVLGLTMEGEGEK